MFMTGVVIVRCFEFRDEVSANDLRIVISQAIQRGIPSAHARSLSGFEVEADAGRPSHWTCSYPTLQGTRESADAYDLRDFLRRSGVPFEWIELTTDTEAQETITNNQTGEQQVVKTHWLFLCLGDVPHTEWAGADGIVRDEQNYLGNSA
jgi:hypothetical protein